MSKTYMNNWYSNGVVVNDADCKAIAEKDAELFLSDRNVRPHYVKKNLLTYTVCIKTWLSQIEDISPRSAYSILQGMRLYGLRDMIRRADESASRLICNWDQETDEPTGFETFISDAMSKKLGKQDILQVLRYAKKLTVTCDKGLEDATIAGVLDANRSCREASSIFNPIFNVSPNSLLGRVIEGVKADAKIIFKNFSEYYNEEDVRFTSGTCNDCGKLLADKLYTFATEQPFIFDRMYFFPTTWDAHVKQTLKPEGEVKRPFDVGFNCFDPYIAKLSCVPKSYKTYRPVAPESAWRQAHLQAVKAAMERCVAESPWSAQLEIKDQDLNRDVAREGSISGHYATIDLSSASDRIPRVFIQYLFPKDVVDASMRYLARYFEANGKKYKMWMWSTAGASITWITEHVFFFLLANQVTKELAAWNVPFLRKPRTFGDDLIIDSRAFDLMHNILTRFNGKLSETKSYWSEAGGYRESCGAEYFKGEDTSSVYFPRQVIKQDAEGIACLCALQHRLWDTSPRAAAIVEGIVLKLEPRMTAHSPHTECADLWSDIPRFRHVPAPVKPGKDGCVPVKIAFEWGDRKAYLAPVTRFEKPKAERTVGRLVTSVKKDIVDMYFYAKFLKEGNLSQDPLLRLLGVSDQPLVPRAAYRASYVVWDYVVE